MSRRYPGRTVAEKIQLARDKENTRTYRMIAAIDKQSSRRPLKGTGANGHDLWNPHDYRSVAVSLLDDDERVGKTFCSSCGAEVAHVQVDGRWHVRNPDNLPHALSCGEETGP